jgi:hypothetical protein
MKQEIFYLFAPGIGVKKFTDKKHYDNILAIPEGQRGGWRKATKAEIESFKNAVNNSGNKQDQKGQKDGKKGGNTKSD